MKLCTVEMRYSTKIIAGEHRVEKNTKKKEKYCRKTIENAEKMTGQPVQHLMEITTHYGIKIGGMVQEVLLNHPLPIQSGFRRVLEQKMAKIK